MRNRMSCYKTLEFVVVVVVLKKPRCDESCSNLSLLTDFDTVIHRQPFSTDSGSLFNIWLQHIGLGFLISSERLDA